MNNKTLYFIIPTAWLLDAIVFSLCGMPYLHILLGIYTYMLLQQPTRWLIMSMLLIALSIESHLFFGRCCLPLIYLIPLTPIILWLKQRVFHYIWLPWVLTFLFLTIELYLVEPFFAGIPFVWLYTWYTISATLIVIVAGSLTQITKQ